VGVLDKLADQIEFPGVDWSSLSAKFGMPAEEVVYEHVFSYQDEYLNPIFDRVSAKLQNIHLTWDPGVAVSSEELHLALAAWDRVKQDMVDVSRVALDAIKVNFNAMLSPEEELQMERADFQATISAVWLSVMYGVLAHRRAVFQLDDVAGKDIMSNADQLVQICGAVEFLYDSGALDPLKKETAATGALPLVGVAVIAVASVVAIATIAYCLVMWKHIAAVNKQMDKLCSEGLKQGDPELLDRCESLARANKIALENPMKGLGESIGTWLVVGLGAYLLVLTAPALAELAKRKASTS